MTEFLSAEELAPLRQFDTPTVCNALEHLDERYRRVGFSSHPFVCLDPALPPMVGYARTATIRAQEKPNLDGATLREKRLAYYEYIASGPLPGIVVIQDLDDEPGFGAFWGEVNTTVHKALGMLGVVTNGSFRDLDASAPGFQVLGGKVGPSHAHVHVVSTDVPVELHGMGVHPGDLLHADRHGAVVIPHELVRQVAAAAKLLGRREKVILDACKAPDFDIDKLKSAIVGSADIH